MAYYPQSQIKTNLYTNGNEYIVSATGVPYTGYYWKTSKGEYFSGKTPQDLPTFQLYTLPYNIDTPVVNDSLKTNTLVEFPVSLLDIDSDPKIYIAPISNYINLKNINPNQTVFLPSYYPTQPTQQDYQIGEFRRYFCKKTNEIQYVEISKDQFDLLVAQDPQILWQLYLPFFIPWNITGTKEQVARVNKNIVDLTMKNLRLPRFNDYIKNDYTKYYR
jgi:hypothetical protein